MHKCFNLLVHIMLLCTTPSLLLHSQATPPPIQAIKTKERALSYDEILHLIQELQNGNLEQGCNESDLERFNYFFAYLATQGALPNTPLVTDIGELLYAEDLALCGWYSNHWEKTKKFVQKHKAEIIIGSIIVVTAAVVVISGVALTTEAASCAALAGASQVATFKEKITKEDLLSPSIPLEEQGRTLGSLFAHDSFKSLDLPPQLQHEAHLTIDRKFSTDYVPIYTIPQQKSDWTTLYFQERGEQALQYGQYSQALHDFSKVIEVDRLNPDPYLKRSFANLELGQREAAMADYQIYTSQTETTHPFSIQDFSAGFTNGLPKGMYASGESLALFTSDTVTQPIQTGRQIWDALVLLSDLARSEEWSTLGETMAPEIHKLITEWDHLSSRERGELAGFAFGKHGADIVIPGATVKGISRGTQIAKTLKKARRGCEAAERILVLESTAGEIAEIPPKALKNLDHLPPELQKSYHLYEKAQNYLKPYKGYMTEEAAKELIHQAGIPTFPRPPGIPENFRIQLSKRGAGIKYVDPENPGNNIRVMPGKPHSPWEHQQKPYVVEYINGQPIDAAGNMVLDSAPEAHVPLEKYTYKVEIKRSKPGN